MELRKQLENNEQNWKVEKMELLEKFDSERKEWECQWKMMQKKIEELYQEVKLRREKNLNGDEGDIQQMLQFSMPFPQTELSIPMNTERHNHENNTPNTSLDKNSTTLATDCSHSNKENKTDFQINDKNKDVCKTESEKWLAQRMSKTENDTLNDALKEIARVSEELCKYQEEIRTKSKCKRTVPDPADGDSKKKLHIILERNHKLSSKTSRIKQNDILSRGKSSQTSLPILAHNSRTDMLPVQDLDLSWDFSLDLTHSIFPDLNKKPVIQMTTKSKDSDLSLDNYNEGLCHVEEWCDIGGLEEINFSETLFSHFTDVSNLTPEMNEQNVSVSQNGHVHSIDLYPMRLEHSALGSGYSYVNTIKNGKLAAKIDEFNRVVFKTGKGNSVFDEPVNMVPAKKEMSLGHLNCEIPTTEKAITQTLKVLEASEEACANGNFHHSIKTSKTSVPPSQPAGPQNMSSYQNVLQEHNWKRINLSGRPRSADSRSNYGVVEKLLKSYETKTAASFTNSKQSLSKWTQSDFLVTGNNNETLSECLERLHLEKPTKDLQSDSYWQPRQDTVSLKLPEVSLANLSNVKGFSRPARPANRRPPSRWASMRSPSMPPTVRRATH